MDDQLLEEIEHGIEPDTLSVTRFYEHRPSDLVFGFLEIETLKDGSLIAHIKQQPKHGDARHVGVVLTKLQRRQLCAALSVDY